MRTKFIILILISLILICGCIEESPQPSIDLTDYAKLSGRPSGQVLNGGIASSEKLIVNSTSYWNKNNSFIMLQPTGGGVSIGTFSPLNNVGLDMHFGNIKLSDASEGLDLNRSTGVGYIRYQNGLGQTCWTIVRNPNTIYPDELRMYTTNSAPLNFVIAKVYNSLPLLELNTSTGFLSLGTNIATSQLHTTGAVRFQNFGAGTATFDAGGNISSVSDEKYKTNIVPFTSGLSAILNTNPKQFKYNTASGLDTQNTYTGFVAQDLQKSIPAAVYSKPDVKYEQVLSKKAMSVDEEDEYTTIEIPLGTNTLSIDDRAIIATLVNAVKEQQLQINDLKSRIDKLEGKKP